MFVGQYEIVKSLVSTIRKSMCSVSQNCLAHHDRVSAPLRPGSYVQRFLIRSPLLTSSRPYSCSPRTSGLNHGSKTVTPIASRNSPMRLRQPDFFSAARDATKSIGPDRYTRAPCSKPRWLLERAIHPMLRGARRHLKRNMVYASRAVLSTDPKQSLERT